MTTQVLIDKLILQLGNNKPFHVTFDRAITEGGDVPRLGTVCIRSANQEIDPRIRKRIKKGTAALFHFKYATSYNSETGIVGIENQLFEFVNFDVDNPRHFPVKKMKRIAKNLKMVGYTLKAVATRVNSSRRVLRK